MPRQARKQAASGFKMHAYCLMGNHVHMLIKVQADGLETILKRIAGRYVYWYNVKYQRVGRLFQDRFKSEPIEDDAYFLTVLFFMTDIIKHKGDPLSFWSYASRPGGELGFYFAIYAVYNAIDAIRCKDSVAKAHERGNSLI